MLRNQGALQAAAAQNEVWDRLDVACGFALDMAAGFIGKKYSGPREAYAFPIYSQLVQRVSSLLLACPKIDVRGSRNFYWDLPSTLALTRNVLEQFATFYYMCGEVVADDERHFRHSCMAVHDLARRAKLIEAFPPREFPAEWEKVRTERLEALEACAQFHASDDKTKKQLRRGFNAPYDLFDYADVLGIPSDQLAYMWALYSDASHAGPISFFQHHHQWTDAGSTLTFEFNCAAQALSTAYCALKAASDAFVSFKPEIIEWAKEKPQRPVWRPGNREVE